MVRRRLADGGRHECPLEQNEMLSALEKVGVCDALSRLNARFIREAFQLPYEADLATFFLRCRFERVCTASIIS